MKLLLEEGVVLPEIEDFGKIALIKGDQGLLLWYFEFGWNKKPLLALIL